jgi:hypothetical protein
MGTPTSKLVACFASDKAPYQLKELNAPEMVLDICLNQVINMLAFRQPCGSIDYRIKDASFNAADIIVLLCLKRQRLLCRSSCIRLFGSQSVN